jgi:hypothetical protein
LRGWILEQGKQPGTNILWAANTLARSVHVDMRPAFEFAKQSFVEAGNLAVEVLRALREADQTARNAELAPLFVVAGGGAMAFDTHPLFRNRFLSDDISSSFA